MTYDQLIFGLITVLLGGFNYFLKMQLNDLKDADKEHRNEIKQIKDNYFKTSDFQNFKNELWARLDRFEDDMKRQLNEKS